MTHKTLTSRHAHAIESCTFQLHAWKPFHLQTLTKTLVESDLSSPNATTNAVHNKRPCLSDRTTTTTTTAATFSIETLDMSKLTLLEDERASSKRERFRWIPRKRRRRGSRSVSGRSSDRSGTRRCSMAGSMAYATCSDFPVAVGTDSSGEFFVNGDVNWASDVSEAKNSRGVRKEGRENGGGSGEKDGLAGSGGWQVGGGVVEERGNESGYGSEPGYRGDAEFGYGDEFDEEEEDGRVLFWGDRFGETDCNMEMVGEHTFSEQKTHHRGRRKKHDWRMVDTRR